MSVSSQNATLTWALILSVLSLSLSLRSGKLMDFMEGERKVIALSSLFKGQNI
jgi:hypothetical protein